MDDDEMMLAKQQTLFETPKKEDEEEEDWSCKKIKSPAGVWYIIKKEGDRDIYEKPTQTGRTRAVFSRNELFNFQQIVKEMPKEERQEWLAEMILFKTAIPGARIESVKVRRSPKVHPTEYYEEDQ